MFKLKIIAIAVILCLVGIILNSSSHFSSSAKGDVLQEIAAYKSWTKITKEPIKVDFQIDGAGGKENVLIIDGQEVLLNLSAGGWSSSTIKYSSLELEKNKTDLVQIFSKVGKGLKKFFVSPKSAQQSVKTETPETTEKAVIEPLALNNHAFSFGVVYANDLAKAEIEKENPQFPVGSIIVREKNPAIDSATPETVIAMVKREKGFSAETGDWEFFVFDGADLKMQKRETKGDCAACHIRAEKTDWIFRDYLK